MKKQNVRLKKLVADQARGHRVIAGSTRECAPGVRRFLVIEYLGIGVSGYLRFSPQWLT